jgi:hypothetical protein
MVVLMLLRKNRAYLNKLPYKQLIGGGKFSTRKKWPSLALYSIKKQVCETEVAGGLLL